jgi:hypothetical protein
MGESFLVVLAMHNDSTANVKASLLQKNGDANPASPLNQT